MKNADVPGLSEENIHTILKILPKMPILFFGSRAKGTHSAFSDLDICLKGQAPIPLVELALIKEKLQESDLPFKVDVVDWHDISQDFKRLISESAVSFS
jgi:uncharacterized protein